MVFMPYKKRASPPRSVMATSTSFTLPQKPIFPALYITLRHYITDKSKNTKPQKTGFFMETAKKNALRPLFKAMRGHTHCYVFLPLDSKQYSKNAPAAPVIGLVPVGSLQPLFGDHAL